MIALHDREACTGCTACAMVCPVQCIQMVPDQEGFLYPVMDTQACIHCGRCERACPVSVRTPEKPFPQDAYVLQYRDDRVRQESTSGGAFSAIAEWVIGQGGVVYGAALREDCTVAHMAAETVGDLQKFRNSKYVQSDPGSTFREAREHLEKGRWVCYSGTPCQVEGFQAFLGKEYGKLVLVDIVCRAVPSPAVWKKYLEMQREALGEYSGVLFRDKHHGYKYSAMSFFDAGRNKIYAQGIDTDPMLRAFFSNICDRPSCYHCAFKKRYRVSDFTLWDCFPVFLYDKEMDDDKGTSSVLIHSDKGRQVFREIRDRVRCRQVDPGLLAADMREMVCSVEKNPRREAFFRDMERMTGRELFRRYFPQTAKVRCARFLRVGMCRLGIYGAVKRAVTRQKIRRIRKQNREDRQAP